MGRLAVVGLLALLLSGCYSDEDMKEYATAQVTKDRVEHTKLRTEAVEAATKELTLKAGHLRSALQSMEARKAKFTLELKKLQEDIGDQKVKVEAMRAKFSDRIITFKHLALDMCFARYQDEKGNVTGMAHIPCLSYDKERPRLPLAEAPLKEKGR